MYVGRLVCMYVCECMCKCAGLDILLRGHRTPVHLVIMFSSSDPNIYIKYLGMHTSINIWIQDCLTCHGLQHVSAHDRPLLPIHHRQQDRKVVLQRIPCTLQHLQISEDRSPKNARHAMESTTQRKNLKITTGTTVRRRPCGRKHHQQNATTRRVIALVFNRLLRHRLI